MNCLNRVEVQEYIDNELSDFRKAEIHDHLKECGRCREVYQEALSEIGIINGLLGELDRDLVSEPIQRFSYKHTAKRRRISQYIIEIAIAASVLLFILFFRPKSEIIQESIPESEMLRFELCNEVDLNKMWHEGIPANLNFENFNPINDPVNF